jgi:mannose-6-phosphate isomerase class I
MKHTALSGEQPLSIQLHPSKTAAKLTAPLWNGFKTMEWNGKPYGMVWYVLDRKVLA